MCVIKDLRSKQICSLYYTHYITHLFGRRLKSSQIEASFIAIFLKCANIMRVLGKYYCINLCVSPIYEAGQKDSQVHTYNENLQSTFLKMLKCNFAMFSIWQASTWQTDVISTWPVHQMDCAMYGTLGHGDTHMSCVINRVFHRPIFLEKS